MKKKYLDAAEVINQAYAVKSDYDLKKKYDYFMVYDDDITAVLKSVHIYKYMKKGNPSMKFVVVGGEGLLAVAFKVMRFSLKARGKAVAEKMLKPETEAGRLKRVALELGVKEEDIIVADEGRNTTENLRAMSKIAHGKKALVVSTQRLAMVFKTSADYQCNQHPEEFDCRQFNYDMLVISQKVSETLCWYNFQAAGGGRVAMHLFASLVRRFEVYDNKYLLKPFEPSDRVKKADALLRNKFLIKQRHTGLKLIRAYLQYIPILWSIFWNAEDYIIDENDAIGRAKRQTKFYAEDFYGAKNNPLFSKADLKDVDEEPSNISTVIEIR